MATYTLTRGAQGGVTVSDGVNAIYTVFPAQTLLEETATGVKVSAYDPNNVAFNTKRFEIAIADTLTVNGAAFTQSTVAALHAKLRDEVFFKVNSVDDFRITGATLNRWYTAPMTCGPLTTVNAGAGANIFAFFFPVTKAITIDQMALEVTTLGTTANQRVGIYNDDGNGTPTTLVVDAGEQATTSTGVKVFTTGLPKTLSPGGYWLATAGNGTGTVIRGLPVANMFNYLGMPSTLGSTPGVCRQANFTYAALPGTFPSAGAAFLTSAASGVWVRLSA